jgi:phosphate transport system permease protein
MQKTLEHIAVFLSWFVSLALLAGVVLLIAFLFGRGGSALGLHFFFGDTPWQDALLNRRPVFGGIWPALLGTFTLVAVASLIAVPIGLAGGIYLSQYASARHRAFFGGGVDILAGIPSVVMGLFGFSLILFLRKTLIPQANTCLLLSAGCIALLVLPYLIRATSNALHGLPESLCLTGPSLGLTRWQNISHVLLPSAGRGLLSGVILAVGRAAEDTAVIMLTGVVANSGIPHGLTAKYEAVPFRIYVLASEYRNATELNHGFGCALVLLLFTASLFGGAYVLQRSLERRWNR